jgi:transcriptional regulator with XRE-family HTH domain
MHAYMKSLTCLIYIIMEQKQSIPNMLLIHRKRAGLRQLDVARALKFGSTDRISRWERGLMVPHLNNLFKLCALYKALPHEVYGELFKTIADQVSRASHQDGQPFRPE